MSNREPTAAERACLYILDRAQADPNLGYYIGPYTRSFELLCLAEAEITGEGIEAVQRRRGVSLCPPHNSVPDVPMLREQVKQLKRRLEEGR